MKSSLSFSIIFILFSICNLQDPKAEIETDFKYIVETSKKTLTPVAEGCKSAICLQDKICLGTARIPKLISTDTQINAELGLAFSVGYKFTADATSRVYKFRFEVLYKNVVMEKNGISRNIKVYDESVFSFNVNKPATYIALIKELEKYKITLTQFFDLVQLEFLTAKDDIQLALTTELELYYKDKPVDENKVK